MRPLPEAVSEVFRIFQHYLYMSLAAVITEIVVPVTAILKWMDFNTSIATTT